MPNQSPGITLPGIPSGGNFGYANTSDVLIYDPNSHSGSGATGGVARATGTRSYAIASTALLNQTVAPTDDIAIGENAMGTLAGETTGGSIAIGTNALGSATGYNPAQPNTCIGYNAGGQITLGQSNVAVGFAALAGACTSYNTAIGDHALNACQTQANTGIGFTAGQALTTGQFNTAVGCGALKTCQTGANNVAIGYNAVEFLTGQNCVGIGYQALHLDSTGNANLAIGTNALQSLTTGNNNIAIGYQAGYTGTPANATVAGGANLWVGLNTGPGTTADPSNCVALGYGCQCDASGGVAIGIDQGGGSAHATAANMFVLGTANHQIKISNNTTGAGSAVLGANCPAVTVSAPYTWLKLYSSDGSTVYVPAWK